MKNKEIYLLQTLGIQAITALDVDEAHAYKIYKLKRALNIAFKSLQEKYMDILKEIGIEDVEALKKQIAAKKKVLQTLSSDEKKAYDDLCSKLDRHEKLQKQMDEDDTPLEGIKTIPYHEWRLLQKENRNKTVFLGDKALPNVDILSGEIEVILEGVLWEPPVDDENV